MLINVGMLPLQVQQRMHLHGAFVLPESGPGKQRKAQVNGGRVQRIQACIQIDADRIARVQRPGDADQDLREIREDASVMGLIGAGQGQRYLAAQPHMVEFACHRPQARLDINPAISK